MKKTPDTVKKWIPYALWDFAGIQGWLNEQAASGYALAGWPGFTFIGRVPFRKDPDAVHARYCLDPLEEMIGDYELQCRRESYEEAGWHYTAKIGKLYAVYRCDDPEIPELYSDTDSLLLPLKKQLRRATSSLILVLFWIVVLFRSELAMLAQWPAEFLLNFILKTEIFLPLYGIMLIMVLSLASGEISIFRGIRRVRKSLEQGTWPLPGRKCYQEVWRYAVSIAAAGVLILFLVWLGVSGTMHTQELKNEADWKFPHAAFEETLPSGAVILKEYTTQEMLHENQFRHSFLAPEQYDTAQEGKVYLDGQNQESGVYQDHIRTSSESLAHAVYRGKIAEFLHGAEDYRENWEENTMLHPDDPKAYDFFTEENVAHPSAAELTSFRYQFCDEDQPRAVYIGRMKETVFYLQCSGFADAEKALELLVDRMAEDIA